MEVKTDCPPGWAENTSLGDRCGVTGGRPRRNTAGHPLAQGLFDLRQLVEVVHVENLQKPLSLGRDPTPIAARFA
ncbi:hypothetical protein [Nonomuraea sp. NPDC050786]|uniref:hypothetical protein n=1 Tax=Nonomuraea sp. NPDC050786 TaxID=3154840 RepID=UPI0033D91527